MRIQANAPRAYEINIGYTDDNDDDNVDDDDDDNANDEGNDRGDNENIDNVIVRGENENLFISSYFVFLSHFMIEKRKMPSSIQFEYILWSIKHWSKRKLERLHL